MTDEELILQVAQEVMDFDIDPNFPWFLEQLFVKRKSEKAYWGFNPVADANHRDQVVERMRELGFLASIEQGRTKWEITFDPWHEGTENDVWIKPGEDNTISHESIGHAVCEAAIAAIRSK